MNGNRFRAALLAVALVAVGLLAGLTVSAALPSSAAAPTVQQRDWKAELAALDDRIAALPTQQQAFVLVSKRIKPAVVTISSERIVKTPDLRFRIPEEFRRFFDDDDFFGPEGGQEQRVYGLGSGVIVDSNGIILTNNHVVAQAEEIEVKLSDNRKLDAVVVGTDPASDLAVLRVDEEGLPTVSFGDSDKIEVGEWVLAVGNPFSESLHHTVTAGIISAKGREGVVGGGTTYQDFIQTDAAINPGNSGGALVNMRGELIGINTAIASRSGTFDGVGFAIPSNLARFVMDSLLKHGKVIRGYIGVGVSALDESTAASLGLDRPAGALVTEVEDGTPAERAGLKRYDVILKLNGEPVDNSQDLTNRIAVIAPGTEVKLTIWRDNREIQVKVILSERPSDLGAESESEPSGETGGVLERLGMEVTPLTDQLARRLGYENESGVVITGVRSGGPAERKGLRSGDLIQEINRRQVRSMADFNDAISALKPGDAVLFYILRGEQGGGIIALEIPE